MAAGIDAISPEVLKQCAVPITPVVFHVLNLCISSCTLPNEWRTHLIVPIHKSGPKPDIKNYRPISLLCILSKLLERLIYDDKVINLASPVQFGFIRGRSSLQQMLLFIKSVVEAHELSTSIDAIYLDIRKAFDSVPHNDLLTKLWSLEICGSLWKWFSTYLSNKQQCVWIGEAIWEVLPVLSGVPQGSILCPLLFILYINDLPSLFKALLSFLFADDTKCIHAAKTTDDFNIIQEDLNIASFWSVSSNLSFKCVKCAVLHFWCNNNNTAQYHLDEKIIDSRELINDLGIMITSDLLVIARAYKQLGPICCSFKTNCISVKKIIYFLGALTTYVLLSDLLIQPC